MKQKSKQHTTDEATRPADQQPVETVHNHANPTFATKPLPPQPPELLAGQVLLGKPVRAMIGGHMSTIFLTDYEADSETYDGLLIRCRSMDTNDKTPDLKAVTGLRAYPYTARPDYAFQFILPGEDESVLINIANASIAMRQG
jgi:hypothetical protein